MRKSLGIGVGGMVLLSEAFGPSAMAACSNNAPTAGTTVACTGTVTAPVTAATGAANVTINADASATASFTRGATATVFSVDNTSQVSNSGSLTLTGGGSTGTARGA